MKRIPFLLILWLFPFWGYADAIVQDFAGLATKSELGRLKTALDEVSRDVKVQFAFFSHYSLSCDSLIAKNTSIIKEHPTVFIYIKPQECQADRSKPAEVYIKWLPSENTALIPDCFRDQTEMDKLMDYLKGEVKQKVNSTRNLRYLESMDFIARKLRDAYVSCKTDMPLIPMEELLSNLQLQVNQTDTYKNDETIYIPHTTENVTLTVLNKEKIVSENVTWQYEGHEQQATSLKLDIQELEEAKTTLKLTYKTTQIRTYLQVISKSEELVISKPVMTTQDGKEHIEKYAKDFSVDLQVLSTNSIKNGKEDGFTMFIVGGSWHYSRKGTNGTSRTVKLLYSPKTFGGQPDFDAHGHPTNRSFSSGDDVYGFIHDIVFELDDYNSKRKDAYTNKDKSSHTAKNGYISFVDTPNYQDALIILDIAKAKNFFAYGYTQHRVNTIYSDAVLKWSKKHAKKGIPFTSLQYRQATIEGVKAVLKSATDSGIGYYTSNDKINFVLQNK